MAFIITGAGLPNHDTKHWNHYRVSIGACIVQFQLPPGQSADFPGFPIPKKVDVGDPTVFDSANNGPQIVLRYWDYRLNRFSKIYGTLEVVIGMEKSERRLDSYSQLEAAIQENFELEKIRQSRESKTPRTANSLSLERVIVAGKDGILAHQKIAPPYYILPIDDYNFLTIFVDGNSVSKPGWSEDAKAAAAAIFDSIRVTECK